MELVKLILKNNVYLQKLSFDNHRILYNNIFTIQKFISNFDINNDQSIQNGKVENWILPTNLLLRAYNYNNKSYKFYKFDQDTYQYKVIIDNKEIQKLILQQKALYNFNNKEEQDIMTKLYNDYYINIFNQYNQFCVRSSLIYMNDKIEVLYHQHWVPIKYNNIFHLCQHPIFKITNNNFARTYSYLPIKDNTYIRINNNYYAVIARQLYKVSSIGKVLTQAPYNYNIKYHLNNFDKIYLS